VQIGDDGAKSPVHPMRVVNVGPSGMEVRSSRPVPVGASGAVLARSSSGEVLLMGASVAYCQPRDELYACGLAFGPKPAEVDLEDFRSDDGVLLDPCEDRPERRQRVA
jgi:hypothetical protein